jgi:aryl-alcohol dehydrogenase-like predicted oxidoreductase
MTRTTGTTLRSIPGTDLEVFPLCLGGNVFGWTADEAASFEVLDAYVAGGGNFIDTADVYSAWVEGHRGGESEEVIGRWLAARGRPENLVIASKVGAGSSLSRDDIRRGVDGSLQRLGVDHIDLYYAHRDDADTPLEETVAASSRCA